MRPGAWLSVVAIAALVGLTAATAVAQSGLTVSEVRFEGNERYSDQVLLQRVKLKPGQMYDDRRHEQDIKELYKFFRTVRPETRVSGDKVVLVYHVAENPLVVSVEVTGNEAVSNAEILDRIGTKRGYPLFSYALDADRRDIVRWFREKGHHFVDVRVAVQDKAGGKAVVFVVTQGPRVQVSEIEFRGNVSFEGDDLEDVLASRPGWILNRTDFVQKTVEQDVVWLMDYYRSEGFRDVRA